MDPSRPPWTFPHPPSLNRLTIDNHSSLWEHQNNKTTSTTSDTTNTTTTTTTAATSDTTTMMATVPAALNDSMQSDAPDVPPPRRNLTNAFEELFDDCDDDERPDIDSAFSPPRKETEPALISPTGVADMNTVNNSAAAAVWPGLSMQHQLQRELSQAVLDRVSVYGVIFDINKECTAMAAADPVANSAAAAEEQSALVTAVTGTAVSENKTAVTTVCIDEEEWLLSTIADRNQQEIRSCPDTFLQAMGEKEYENPVQSLAGKSRTQLWKPSRSWWEAKSGKNPWIEPASHNKRWRYLWPLIHYHKFLAKCIKKLKRNGVDVKQSVSPVAVFLREEVCAVSDHLAAVSLFGSDEWMDCLQHFDGWTDTSAQAEEQLRSLVANLKLRALAEPGDVDSPMLRSQIDTQFLRSMAATRLELREKNESARKPKRETPLAPPTAGHPPMYPRSQSSPSSGQPVPRQVTSGQSAVAAGGGGGGGGMRRPRWGYPPPHGNHWGYHPGYEQQQQPFAGDNSSVQSGLSVDSYHQPYPPEYGMYPGQMHPYYHAGPTPPYSAPSDHSQSTAGYEQHHQPVYDPTHGWIDPNMAYAMHQQAESSGYYAGGGAPTSPGMAYTPEEPSDWQAQADHTPYKYDPNTMQAHSPFWAHLDKATLALGLATPAKASPSTPRRKEDKRDDQEGEAEKSYAGDSAEEKKDENGFAANAQPLLLRHNQYYGYGPYGAAGAAEGGYGPPSPATQFLMSPQASFAFNYGYGVSPRRSGSRSTPRQSKKTPKPVAHSPSAAASMTPLRKVALDRESPSTVETTAETESCAEPAAV